MWKFEIKSVLPIILISLEASMSWALSWTISSQIACVNRLSPSRLIVSSVMRQNSRVGNEVGTYGRIRKRSTFALEFCCLVWRIYWQALNKRYLIICTYHWVDSASSSPVENVYEMADSDEAHRTHKQVVEVEAVVWFIGWLNYLLVKVLENHWYIWNDKISVWKKCIFVSPISLM